jgi:uncharacterized protein YndB with AHSA1/START domain
MFQAGEAGTTKAGLVGEPGRPEVVVTRVFDAPRELVWKAWTQPERIVEWFNATPGLGMNVLELDVRPGGRLRFAVPDPDGGIFPGEYTGTFLAVKPPEELVFDVVDFSMAENPAGTLAFFKVRFETVGKQTLLTLVAALPDESYRDMTVNGWNGSFDKLAESLRTAEKRAVESKTKIIAEPGKPEVVITRTFGAPRGLLWKVYTDPKLIPQWWGPRILMTTVDRMDVRPGGTWRFIQRGPDGAEYAFNGEYREVAAPERIVNTFEFEGMPGHVVLETCTLEALEGKTKMTVKSVFQSVQDRDGMIASGMEWGMVETHDRLEELLKKEKTAKRQKVKKAIAPIRRKSRSR